ncbi:Mll3551 protein [alpha proteobacterium U9-1i]|nr:Mll3551 protein [alpha proteobacterium U9-1i]
MKSPFAALGLSLGLIALAGPASAQSAQAATAGPRVEAVYSAHARGMNVGDFTYNFSQTGQTYEVSAARRTTGIARSLLGSQQDYSYSVRGAVAGNGALRPQAYTHRGGRRDRVVRSTFSADDITTTSEPRMGMGNPAATQAQKRGAVDQLTAIATMITASSDPCSGTVKVYMDGRSRFDFVLTPNGRVNVNTAAFQGEALRCSVQFRPIAGFSDPQEAATLTFLFAPTSSGLYAPVRIEMPSDDVGVIRLEARRLTVNGTRLR